MIDILLNSKGCDQMILSQRSENVTGAYDSLIILQSVFKISDCFRDNDSFVDLDKILVFVALESTDQILFLTQNKKLQK